MEEKEVTSREFMPAKNATDLMEIWVTNLLDFYFLNYWVLGCE
jgi:hypothetical protein